MLALHILIMSVTFGGGVAEETVFKRVSPDVFAVKKNTYSLR